MGKALWPPSKMNSEMGGLGVSDAGGLQLDQQAPDPTKMWSAGRLKWKRQEGTQQQQ